MVVSTHPSPRLVENGLKVAFEESAGVLEVLFGVGFGGGDALKRFVEDADDSLLFGERGHAESTVDRLRSRLNARLCTHRCAASSIKSIESSERTIVDRNREVCAPLVDT